MRWLLFLFFKQTIEGMAATEPERGETSTTGSSFSFLAFHLK